MHLLASAVAAAKTAFLLKLEFNQVKVGIKKLSVDLIKTNHSTFVHGN